MLGSQRTELSVCGVGVAWRGCDSGRGPSSEPASPCPPPRSHCTDGDTEARRSQHQPRSPNHWESQPPPWPLLPIFQVPGCASGKRATSCWWQSRPAGKSSSESNFRPRPQGSGDGAGIPLLWALVAASCRLSQSWGLSPPPVHWAGPGGPVWSLCLCSQHEGLGSPLCGCTCTPVGERRPVPGWVPRTCCTATFDLLLRLWVWPRPRSRLLREVWACIPAQGPWARRGGPGGLQSLWPGDQGTWATRPPFPAAGSGARGTPGLTRPSLASSLDVATYPDRPNRV